MTIKGGIKSGQDWRRLGSKMWNQRGSILTLMAILMPV